MLANASISNAYIKHVGLLYYTFMLNSLDCCIKRLYQARWIVVLNVYFKHFGLLYYTFILSTLDCCIIRLY